MTAPPAPPAFAASAASCPPMPDFARRPGLLFVDGRLVEAASGRTFDTINPATEAVLTSVAEGDAADIDLAVAAARRAFEDGPWPRMAARERGRILQRIADLVLAHAEELALLEVLVFAWMFHIDRGWAEIEKGALARPPRWLKPVLCYVTPAYLAGILG